MSLLCMPLLWVPRLQVRKIQPEKYNQVSKSNATRLLVLGSLPGSLVLKSPQLVVAQPKHCLTLYHLYRAGLQRKKAYRSTQSWLERCPVLKSICYSCKGWGFSSQYLPGSSQLSVTPVRGPLPISTDTRHMRAIQTYTQANTHTHQIKSF